MRKLLFWPILVCTFVLAGCQDTSEAAPGGQEPGIDYSWVATTSRAELAGHYDRANVFIYKNYYDRQAAYASGEIPSRFNPFANTSHPLAYYSLEREPSQRLSRASSVVPARTSSTSKVALTQAPARAKEESATDPAARHFSRGLTYYDLGDFDSAVKEFSSAIKLNPRHARAFAFRALAYGYLGNAVEAQTDLELAIRLKADPKLVEEVRRALKQKS
jgi:tetratricopeptide (TPR) repeat protein